MAKRYKTLATISGIFWFSIFFFFQHRYCCLFTVTRDLQQPNFPSHFYQGSTWFTLKIFSFKDFFWTSSNFQIPSSHTATNTRWKGVTTHHHSFTTSNSPMKIKDSWKQQIFKKHNHVSAKRSYFEEEFYENDIIDEKTKGGKVSYDWRSYPPP